MKEVIVSLKDEPGSREIVAVPEAETETGVPYGMWPSSSVRRLKKPPLRPTTRNSFPAARAGSV